MKANTETAARPPLFIPDGFAPGIFPGEPDEVYFQRRLGVASNSRLKILEEETPATYLAYVRGELPERMETESLLLGRAFHCLVLEPAEFVKRYAIKTRDFNLQTKAGRLDYEQWANDQGGKSIIDARTFTTIKLMRESLLRHRTARLLVERGQREVVFRWFDPETGVPCEGKMDLWDPDMAYSLDLKSSMSANPRAFSRSVAEYRYHVQHCMYATGALALGVKLERFFFAPVEKEPPYLSAVYHLDDAAVERGMQLLRRGLGNMAGCLSRLMAGAPDDEAFPGYGHDIRPLSLPGWAFAD